MTVTRRPRSGLITTAEGASEERCEEMAMDQAAEMRLAPHPGMVWVPGGTFLMGSDDHYPEEAPAHRVSVDGFWMDQHTVTNQEFARFVKATRHVTVAE